MVHNYRQQQELCNGFAAAGGPERGFGKSARVAIFGEHYLRVQNKNQPKQKVRSEKKGGGRSRPEDKWK
jgi:hypothetical protein